MSQSFKSLKCHFSNFTATLGIFSKWKPPVHIWCKLFWPVGRISQSSSPVATLHDGRWSAFSERGPNSKSGGQGSGAGCEVLWWRVMLGSLLRDVPKKKKQKESVHFNVFERFPPKQRKQRASPKWQTWYKFRLSVRLGSQRNCCDVDVSVSLAWKHLETYYGQIPIQHAWTGTKRVAAEWGEWRYLLLWLWLLWPWLSGSWTFQPTLPATFSW